MNIYNAATHIMQVSPTRLGPRMHLPGPRPDRPLDTGRVRCGHGSFVRCFLKLRNGAATATATDQTNRAGHSRSVDFGAQKCGWLAY